MARTFDDLLRETAELKASDIYLAAGAVPCVNIDGVYTALPSIGNVRLTPDEILLYARQAMSPRQWDEFERTFECNLAYMAPATGRFRINVFWQRGSVAMVCRRVIMDIPTLRSLGLPPVLRDISLADRGIVLITGSTGSGKSTTQASMMDYRNHLRTGHIVTIEDPVEFVYRHRRSIVTQREVGIDTLSFHEALKNTLRQAPSVICIGEVRDAETIQFAMHASETGHLVFATLHSTNATLAIERILHFYPGEFKQQILMQLSLNLKAIICQRLVLKQSGGRVVAVEVLINTPRIQDLIAKGDMSSLKMALASDNQDGLTSFDKSLYKLHKTGKITMEDALTAAESANDLAIKFRGVTVSSETQWNDFTDQWAGIQGDYDVPEESHIAQRIKNDRNTSAYNNEHAPALVTSSDEVKKQDIFDPTAKTQVTPRPVLGKTPLVTSGKIPPGINPGQFITPVAARGSSPAIPRPPIGVMPINRPPAPPRAPIAKDPPTANPSHEDELD